VPKQAQTTRRRYGSLAQPGPVALPGWASPPGRPPSYAGRAPNPHVS